MGELVEKEPLTDLALYTYLSQWQYSREGKISRSYKEQTGSVKKLTSDPRKLGGFHRKESRVEEDSHCPAQRRYEVVWVEVERQNPKGLIICQGIFEPPPAGRGC
jgi:hypothetical protein